MLQLKELGLSEGQVKVYISVLELGIASLKKIQEKTGLERRSIYDILNKLIEKGLISYTVENNKSTYQCTHPNKLLEDIKEKQKSLKELEDKIPDVKKLFAMSKPDIRSEVYRGNEGVKSLLDEILDYKESFWMGGNSMENYKAVPEGFQIWFYKWMERRVKKKHMMYDLVSHGMFLKGLEPSKKEEHEKKFYKYKSLPDGMYVPLVIVIFGNKVAQIQWDRQSFAFVIESEKAKSSFMKYFHHFWDMNVQALKGVDKVYNAWDEMLEELEKGEEYYVLGSPWFGQRQKIPEWFPEFHTRRQAKGVKARFLFVSGTEKLTEKNKKYYYNLGQVRFLAQNIYAGMQINIYHDKILMLVWKEKDPIVFKIEDKIVHDTFKSYYDTLWKQARI